MASTEPGLHGPDHRGDRLHNPLVGHEDTDINVRTVLSFGVGMVVVAVTCAVVIRVLFGVLERQAVASDPRPTSAVARPAGQLPPAPRLLTNEPAALAKFHAEEAKELDGYGWVDQLGGVAHIPVAEAKKLLAERGLPVRSAPADPTEGTHAPAMGESSGGRTIPSKAAAAAAPVAPADGGATPAPAKPAGSAPAEAKPGGAQ